MSAIGVTYLPALDKKCEYEGTERVATQIDAAALGENHGSPTNKINIVNDIGHIDKAEKSQKKDGEDVSQGSPIATQDAGKRADQKEKQAVWAILALILGKSNGLILL